MLHNGTVPDADGKVDFDNLYPALFACFVHVLLGYFAGRINLLSDTEAKGIHTFISNFALPSIIFLNLTEMDLSIVNWKFLLAIFLGKTIIFFLIIVFYILLKRPRDIASAGILAIFSTQSNDFAIGYPIAVALYSTTHPDYPGYMYLVAPINLAILNPIGFALIEFAVIDVVPQQNFIVRSMDRIFIHSRRNTCYQKLRKIINLIGNIVTNPIIFMTILGIIMNLIFSHKMPLYLNEVLKVLGAAFPACALFVLGLRMVGKIRNLQGVGFLLPGLLILAKLIALPELIRQLVIILHCGVDDKDTTDLSTFGYFYGTIPAAPSVFIFAAVYNVNVDLIATSMVACTFLSAPLMFVSAKMISLANIDPSEYVQQLNNYSFDLSIASLVTALWVLLVFVLAKKITKIPHRFTACLLVSQIITCIGAIMWSYVDHTSVAGYIQFCLFTGGTFSSRLWTAIISITLLFMESRNLCFILFKLQPYFLTFGWGLPILITGLLLLDKTKHINEKNENFVYGTYQAIVAVSLLVLCFVVTIGCLILNQMYKRRHNDYAYLIKQSNPEDIEPTTSSLLVNSDESENIATGAGSTKYGSLPTINESAENSPNPPVTDIEDLFISTHERRPDIGSEKPLICDNSCPAGLGCNSNVSQYCQGIVRQYQEPIDEDLELIEEDRSNHNPQVLRHCVLLILLLVSMFIGLVVCIWTLVMEDMTGIYVEMTFLDVTMNLGQSFIVFAVFGTDTKDILLPLLKSWRKLLHSDKQLILPMQSELTSETVHICDQFTKYHLENCKNEIEKNKRWRWKVYEKVFTGKNLVDWLIKIGLARDRIDAINYARHLVEGRVLKHINEIYHFYDRNLLYTFN